MSFKLLCSEFQLETWCLDQKKAMLFIAKSHDQILFKPPLIANDNRPRGKSIHQLALAMKKELKWKEVMKQGSRLNLQVRVSNFQSSSLQCLWSVSEGNKWAACKLLDEDKRN